MIALHLKSLKEATRKLFLEDTFDFFDLSEASFSCQASYHIDGHTNEDFYDEEEKKEGLPDFVSWKQLRPVCFQMIRGKKVPVSFKIVFFLSAAKAADIFSETALEQNQDINGYCLTFSYRTEGLVCSSGVSFLRFSMDRETPKIWDRTVSEWLEKAGLLYEEL